MIAARSIGPALMAAVLLAATQSCAFAQPFPSQPIRIINPYAVGGAVEAMVRLLAQRLAGSDWPAPVIENRPGASGTIAALATKQAKPDGYTLMSADTVSHALAVSLVDHLAYDPVKDFTPITLIWTFATVLAVPENSPAKTVADLVALARQKPGGLDYASQGTGSAGHVLGALFQKSAGAPMNHVAYRGAGPAMPDLVAGRVDFMFSTLGTIRPFAESKQVRILANSSKDILQGIPPMGVFGHPDVHYEAWFGLVGPLGLDQKIVDTIRDRVTLALALPDVIDALNGAGLVPRTSTPQQMRDLMQSDIARLGPVVREAVETKK